MRARGAWLSAMARPSRESGGRATAAASRSRSAALPRRAPAPANAPRSHRGTGRPRREWPCARRGRSVSGRWTQVSSMPSGPSTRSRTSLVGGARAAGQGGAEEGRAQVGVARPAARGARAKPRERGLEAVGRDPGVGVPALSQQRPPQQVAGDAGEPGGVRGEVGERDLARAAPGDRGGGGQVRAERVVQADQPLLGHVGERQGRDDLRDGPQLDDGVGGDGAGGDRALVAPHRRDDQPRPAPAAHPARQGGLGEAAERRRLRRRRRG